MRAVRKNLLHASPLDSGRFLAVFGVLWLIEASPQFLASSSQSILLVCLQISPLFIKT